MFLRNVRLGAALALLLGAVTPLTAQQIAAIRGTVTRSGDNQALAGVVVTLKGTPRSHGNASRPLACQ